MTDEDKTLLGFIGLGTMGEPMALNLLRSEHPLVVWNRSAEKMAILAQAGAQTARNPSELFGGAKTVFLMLASESAIDEVLGRGTSDFAPMVADHLIVNMGTPSPGYSEDLARDLRFAGARYVEAPVSGQRGPAQSGQLVAMLAGEGRDVEAVKPLLHYMCREVIMCGAVPKAVATKLASNVFVGTMMAALAESVNYARHLDVDLQTFLELMTTGPMASPLIRMKLPKLIEQDFSVQASIATVLATTELITSSASAKGVAVPLLALSGSLYEAARSLGYEGDDVTAVILALERMGDPSPDRDQ